METNFIIWLPRKDEQDERKVPLNDPDKDPNKPNGVIVDVVKEKEDEETPKAKQSGYKMKGLVYGVDDKPPLQIALVCAFQVDKIYKY